MCKSYLLLEMDKKEVRLAINGDGMCSLYLVTSVFVSVLCEIGGKINDWILECKG